MNCQAQLKPQANFSWGRLIGSFWSQPREILVRSGLSSMTATSMNSVPCLGPF